MITMTRVKGRHVEAVKCEPLTVFVSLHSTFFACYSSGFRSCNENDAVPITESCAGFILTHSGSYFAVHKQLWHS